MPQLRKNPGRKSNRKISQIVIWLFSHTWKMNIIRIEEKAPPNEKKEEDKIGVAMPEDDDPSKRKSLT